MTSMGLKVVSLETLKYNSTSNSLTKAKHQGVILCTGDVFGNILRCNY